MNYLDVNKLGQAANKQTLEQKRQELSCKLRYFNDAIMLGNEYLNNKLTTKQLQVWDRDFNRDFASIPQITRKTSLLRTAERMKRYQIERSEIIAELDHMLGQLDNVGQAVNKQTLEQQRQELNKQLRFLNESIRRGYDTINNKLTMKQFQAWDRDLTTLPQITKKPRLLHIAEQMKVCMLERNEVHTEINLILDQLDDKVQLSVIDCQGFSLIDRAMYHISKRITAGKAELKLVK